MAGRAGASRIAPDLNAERTRRSIKKRGFELIAAVWCAPWRIFAQHGGKDRGADGAPRGGGTDEMRRQDAKSVKKFICRSSWRPWRAWRLVGAFEWLRERRDRCRCTKCKTNPTQIAFFLGKLET